MSASGGRVAGKVALVTGAGSGLGRAISEMLAREGARVAVTDIDEAAAQETAESINGSTPGAAIALNHDVTEAAAWSAALERTVAEFGGLHILVNNAGIAEGGSIEDTDYETWRRVHAIDLDGVFLGCKLALPHIRASGGGSIVNISSIAAIVAGHNMAAYNSAKAAVRHLTKSVALHCAKQGYGIRCNSVHPAFVRTPILDPLVARFGEEEAYAKLGRQIPLGRIGEPEEVAYGVLYLASDESSFMTGAELVLDGGLSAQ
jgi:NAD(P)-dependent dehydrogenase (short-subunit alcohol dehydrogenase family)